RTTGRLRLESSPSLLDMGNNNCAALFPKPRVCRAQSPEERLVAPVPLGWSIPLPQTFPGRCNRLTTLITSKASIICPGCLIDPVHQRSEDPAGNEIQSKSGALNVKKLLLFFLLLAHGLRAQERQTDPTWLHRYVPDLSETKAGLTSPTCHYRAIFGEGDKQIRPLQTLIRFGQVSLDRQGNCQTVFYDRQEEIYFVVEGAGMLHYQNHVQALRKHHFTYLPPRVKHSIANHSDQPLRVLVMGFKIPSSISI